MNSLSMLISFVFFLKTFSYRCLAELIVWRCQFSANSNKIVKTGVFCTIRDVLQNLIKIC